MYPSRHKEESSSSDDEQRVKTSSSFKAEAGLASGGVSYKKTLRLTSEQLVGSTLVTL